MECATAISVLHYAAVRYAFQASTGSDALFDERFADMMIGRLSQGTENDLKAARKEVGTGNMRPGDHAYFHNPDVSAAAVAGGWNGENVIILGDDQYFGHPFGITSSAEIIEKLNSVKDPAIEEPESAYLGGPVYRLDGEVLWQTVKAHLEENGIDITGGGGADIPDGPGDDTGSGPDVVIDDNDGGSTNDGPTGPGNDGSADDGPTNDGPTNDDPANDDPAGDTCTDVPPAGSDYTCAQQAQWGKCGEPWMADFCDASCGRCDQAGDATPADPAPAVCTDIAPDDDYTCAQQAEWGKCDESWMDGYCDATCGRCDTETAPAPVCTDVAPDSNYTCEQQASWGKCDEPWMADFCDASCGRCAD